MGGIEWDNERDPSREALVAAINGADDGLIALPKQYKHGLVIEWGFSTADLERVKALINRGFDAWYFDGHREAALQGWTRAHPDWNPSLWHTQVGALDANWPAIGSLYRGRIIMTVARGPWHLPPEHIHRLMGLPGGATRIR
jgi:hypothetical protein